MEYNNLSILKKKYEVISYCAQQNSTYGICTNAKKKFFYKISSKESINNELMGFKLAKLYFCTADIQEILTMADGSQALILSYADEVSYNHGLLCDILNDKSSFSSFKPIFDNIIQFYKNSLAQSIIKNAQDSIAYKKFIDNRIKERLVPWYINNKKISTIKVLMGQETYSINEILNKIYFFLKRYKKTNLILSHGDPGDMNFGIKPRIFDLETFGFNPISLEFATFFVNLFIGGSYFFPKYQSDKYIYHNNVYNSVNKVCLKYKKMDETILVRTLEYHLNSKRKYAIEQVIKVFSEAWSESTNKEIISMLIFRYLTIIDINNFQTDDLYIVLILICLIYRGLNEKNIFCYLKSLIR